MNDILIALIVTTFCNYWSAANGQIADIKSCEEKPIGEEYNISIGGQIELNVDELGNNAYLIKLKEYEVTMIFIYDIIHSI